MQSGLYAAFEGNHNKLYWCILFVFINYIYMSLQLLIAHMLNIINQREGLLQRVLQRVFYYIWSPQLAGL